MPTGTASAIGVGQVQPAKNKSPASASNVVITDNGAFSYAELIISIKEARRLLGVDAKDMTDNQIAELILTLTSVASNFLDNLGSTNYNGNQA